MQLKPHEKFAVVRQLADPFDTGTYYVQAKIRNAETDELIDTLNLTDQGNQRFKKNWVVPADPSGEGFYIDIETIVYTDSGYSTVSQNYFRENNVYLVQERNVPPFGGGGADVDYKKLKSIVSEEVNSIKRPKIQFKGGREAEDIRRSLNRRFLAIEKEIKDIDIPEPEKVDLSGILLELQGIKRSIGSLPKPDRFDYGFIDQKALEITSSVEESIKESEGSLKEDLATLSSSVLDAIREFTRKVVQRAQFTFRGEELADLKPEREKEKTPERRRNIFTGGFGAIGVILFISTTLLGASLVYKVKVDSDVNLGDTVRTISQWTSSSTASNTIEPRNNQAVYIGSSTTFANLDCTGNSNGGALTTDANGLISCSDDDSGGGGGGGGIGTTTPWTTGDIVEVASDSSVKSTSTISASKIQDSYILNTGDTITGNLTFSGSGIVIGGDTITEFAGTGLTVSGNDLTADLGVDIDETELSINAPTNGYLLTASSSATGGWEWTATTSPNLGLVQDSDLHDAVTLSGTPDYITLSGQDIIRGTIDIGDDTNLVGGTGITLIGDTLSADLGIAIDSSEITNGVILNEDINASAAIDYSKLNLINSFLEADLKAVNAAVDEDILTYESTTGDFEWHTPSELSLQAQGDVLDDLNSLGVVSSDGEFIVGTGAGAFAYESGATARTSLGLSIGSDVQAWDAFLDDIAALTDPGADRILFWDDATPNELAFLTVSTGLTLSGTNLTADLGTSITSSEITDDEIVNADINSSAAIAYSKLNLTNSILEADLKAVDTAGDEECLTYETTTGDFEWQTCGGSSLWTDGGTNLYPATITDTVSIGTTTAGAPLVVNASTTNRVARFYENAGASEFQDLQVDSSGNLNFVQDGGNTGFQIFDVQLNNNSIAAEGLMSIQSGTLDSDTYIVFSPSDEISFTAGGQEFLQFTESTSDVATFNDFGGDIDFIIESDTLTEAFKVDGASGDVTINGDVITGKQQKNITIESPADADNFLIGKWQEAVTITDIHCIVDPADTGESVVIDIQERNGTGDSPATVDTTITCDNDGAEDDGTLTNGAIDAGDWWSVDIGTVTGTVTQVSISVYYTKQ